VVVGGNGISGPVFMDNADYRTYAFGAFKAQVIDMETAAVGQVAYSNKLPYIAFRSLSDLAGGDPGKNQARAFYPLASENSAKVVTRFIAALNPPRSDSDPVSRRLCIRPEKETFRRWNGSVPTCLPNGIHI
jgi:adenosylhomocysteine nucleosidase